jgi:hypothetical protein
MKSPLSRSGETGKHRFDAEPGTAKDVEPTRAEIAKDAGLTRAEISAAEKLLERTLRWRALPVYSREERMVLAILAANYSQLQRARGKKSKGDAKADAEYRRNHVAFLLRCVVAKRYRDDPTSLATVMEIVGRLDDTGIEASDTQVRRDIHDVLKTFGPLPTW